MNRWTGYKIPGVRNVYGREARELSALAWVRDEELSNPVQEARILPDGRVLLYIINSRRGVLFPSREALADFTRWTREINAQGPFDPAKELLPPLDDFLRDVATHANNLGKVLRLPDEVLDRSIESLNPVYKAVLKLRKAKRLSPEVFTPLVAYVGEVMRLICGGRWEKMPATWTKRVPAYDADELARWTAERPVRLAAGEQAAKDVLARGGSELEAERAKHAYFAEARKREPKPIYYNEFVRPIADHEHEPVIRAHDGRLYQPVAAVIKELVENGARGSLSTAVAGRLYIYLSAQAKAGSPG
jgi:hypothetical protein